MVMTNVALFSGIDLSGNVGLWVTDGTVANTTEITASADYVYDITAIFDGALFGGLDPSTGNYDLWVTDGTATGTTSIVTYCHVGYLRHRIADRLQSVRHNGVRQGGAAQWC